MAIILIVGPSGSGKSTLEKNLVETFPENYEKAISCTTRAPRKGEVNGVDYFFLTDEEFDSREMLERVEFAGNKYGVGADQVSEDKDTVLVVEPHGAEQIIKYCEDHGIDHYLIYMDIPLSIRAKNMAEERGDPIDQVKDRLSKDDIEERFKNSDLEADLLIKKLNPNLHYHVHEWIEVSKRLLKKETPPA